MTEPTNHEGDRPTTGVVEQLARDDVERKRFLVLGKNPTPDGAFAKPMSMSQVLAVVKPFIA